MNIHFVTFGSQKFKNSLERIRVEATESNFFTHFHIFEPSNLPFFYKLKYRNLLKGSVKGFGYWIWKSHITKKVYSKLYEGDILVYVDAGCVINKNGYKLFKEYIRLLGEENISNLSFELEHIELQYTKKALINYLNLDYDDRIIQSPMLMAGVFMIKKCKESDSIVNLWHKLSHKLDLISDKISDDEHSSFIAHRHDQSILSLVRKIYGTHLLKDTTYPHDRDWEKLIDSPFQARRMR